MTGVRIVELLENYKRTQRLEAQGNQEEAKKEEERSKNEPDVPQASRGTAPPKLSYEEAMALEDQEKEDRKAYLEGGAGVDRFRVQRHVCPNPQCQCEGCLHAGGQEAHGGDRQGLQEGQKDH